MKAAVLIVALALCAAVASAVEINHQWTSSACVCSTPTLTTSGCQGGSTPKWSPSYLGHQNGTELAGSYVTWNATARDVTCDGTSCDMAVQYGLVPSPIVDGSLLTMYSFSVGNGEGRSCSLVYMDVPIFDPRIFSLCNNIESDVPVTANCVQAFTAGAASTVVSVAVLLVAVVAGVVLM